MLEVHMDYRPCSAYLLWHRGFCNAVLSSVVDGCCDLSGCLLLLLRHFLLPGMLRSVVALLVRRSDSDSAEQFPECTKTIEYSVCASGM
jgi:hypothetical protein